MATEKDELQMQLEAGLAELVASGELQVVGHGDDGQPRYSLTPKGHQVAEAMLRDAGVDVDAIKAGTR